MICWTDVHLCGERKYSEVVQMQRNKKQEPDCFKIFPNGPTFSNGIRATHLHHSIESRALSCLSIWAHIWCLGPHRQPGSNLGFMASQMSLYPAFGLTDNFIRTVRAPVYRSEVLGPLIYTRARQPKSILGSMTSWKVSF